MNFINFLKGVWKKMIGKEDFASVLKMTPMISGTMKNAIELWRNMYENNSPWLSDNIVSLGLPSLIASEKARMATLEMKIKVTGTTPMAELIKDSMECISEDLRSELEYGLAMGCFVIKPYVTTGPDGKLAVKFTYIHADNFYPLSFSADGNITAAAFVDRIYSGETMYSKVEIQSLEQNKVTVINKAFKTDIKYSSKGLDAVLGDEISLTDVSEWSDILPIATINDTDILGFGYFKNPEANSVDMDSPLGASGFSRAVNLIKNADTQYSNLLWEFEGGQLAIDVDRTALNPVKDKFGKPTEILPQLQERLFRRNLDLGEDNMYNIFSPTLRDESIIRGLNDILMHIEDTCSLARGTISEITSSEARTATELKILKQRAFAANADVQKELEKVLRHICRIIELYAKLYNIAPVGEYEVAYDWDDSIIVDKVSERETDLLDIDKGLLSKVEYRMKWRGETRKQAEDALKEIAEEKKSSMEMVTGLQNDLQESSNPDNKDQESKTDKEISVDKKIVANNSGVVTNQNTDK